MSKSIQDSDLEEARIPRRFWSATPENYFADKAALRTATGYVTKSKKVYREGICLCLRGKPLTGKTLLMICVLKSLMLRGYSCLYISMDELTDLLMNFNKADKEQKNLTLKLKDADFVALDNIGIPNDGNKAAMRRFIRIRVNDGNPCIFGTTLEQEEDEERDLFFNHFGEDARRLFSYSVVVNCNVSSFRIQQHLEKLRKL